MPPVTRRTVSAPASPPNHILQFSLFGPTHLPISPIVGRSRRVHSASSSPYPTTRESIEEARNSSRNADTTRRILGEIDWWVRASGQRDEEEEYEYEEDEEEEWETMPEDDVEAAEDNAPSAPVVDIISHNVNDNDDDDTISEHSDSEASVHSDASTLTGYEVSAFFPKAHHNVVRILTHQIKYPSEYEEEPVEQTASRGSSLLFFPTSFPPLTNLLSAQVGQEPSRRASSRSPPNRPYQTRAATRSSLNWDYSTSSMMITSGSTSTSTSTGGSSSVTPSSPPPSPGRTTICRPTTRRPPSVSPGSVADNIIRDALALTSPPPTPGPTKTNMNFLPLKKFPMNLLMTSPSIMTFR